VDNFPDYDELMSAIESLTARVKKLEHTVSAIIREEDLAVEELDPDDDDDY